MNISQDIFNKSFLTDFIFKSSFNKILSHHWLYYLKQRQEGTEAPSLLFVFQVHVHACACVLGRFSCADSLQPKALKPVSLLFPWEFSRQKYWSDLPCPPPGNLPHPGTEPRSPALQVDSLPVELPGKPKNTGVGSLPLLQGNFPTQQFNWGLQHCRRILYQLSYPGSPPKG